MTDREQLADFLRRRCETCNPTTSGCRPVLGAGCVGCDARRWRRWPACPPTTAPTTSAPRCSASWTASTHRAFVITDRRRLPDLSAEEAGQALLVFTATPGTPDHDKLRLLMVIGAQRLTAGPPVGAVRIGGNNG